MLKNKFYSYLPEISALLKGATEGKKQKTKIPTGKFIERQNRDWIEFWERTWERTMEEKPSKFPRMLKEKTWDVPDLQEIKPGLILEIENIEHGHKEIIEVVSPPFKENETWAIQVKKTTTDSREFVTRNFLTDLGIVPYSNNLWNGWNRPIKWYPKEKTEK